MAGDLQSEKGVQPPGITERGAYVALSDDEGETWRIRRLPGTQPHERPDRARQIGGDTLGYAVARQAPNGVIHLIATMTEPCLHFELNETWILHGDDPTGDDAALRANSATSIRDVREYVEADSAGRPVRRYSGGIGNDGRFLFHGPVLWFYPEGGVQRRATYTLGRLTGREVFFDPEGIRLWQRDHEADGSMTWTTWWPDGTLRTRSTWRDAHAEGTAVLHDPSGREVYRVEFNRGIPVGEIGHPGEY
jgi:hypothetical protein